jgi:hypothetical protein
MVVNLIPADAIVERYHAWEGWPQTLAQKTKPYPVVFNNSYQRASKYWFYSGQMTYSLNKFNDRRNNYNFWPVEDSLLGKPVYIFDIYDVQHFPDTVKAPLFTVGFRFDSSFQSFARIQFRSDDYKIAKGDSLQLRFTLDMPASYATYLQQHPEIDEKIALDLCKGREEQKIIEASFTLQQIIRGHINSWTLHPALAAGDYFFRFGIFSDSGLYTHNSEKIQLAIDNGQ